MKKVLSVLLSLTLIFLCSCSLIKPENKVEERYITFDEISDKKILNLDFNDRYMVVLASVLDDYYDNYCSGEYDPTQDENYDFKYYIYVYDYIKEKCVSEFLTSYKELYSIADVKIDENNHITLVTYDKDSVIYNIKFKQLDAVKIEYPDNKEPEHTNKNINYNRFASLGNFYYDAKIDNTIAVFNDDEENIYYTKSSIYEYPQIVNDKNVFSYCNDYETKHYVSLVNYDTLEKKQVDFDEKYKEHIFGESKEHNNVYAAILGLDMKCEDVIFMWDSSLTTPVENNEIKRVKVDEIDNAIKECEKDIFEKYDVEVESYKDYETEEENAFCHNYVYTNDRPKSELLVTLYDLDYCLSTFPKELYKEMIEPGEGFYEGFDKFKIYLVGEFDESENVAAYANNLNGELYIVYSVSGFTYSTFCHEIFHDMEFGMLKYDRNFDEKWLELNPDGFDYALDAYTDCYYDHEELQDYFARDYGMRNELEDRATVFEMICDTGNDKQADPWWSENKKLMKKVKFLTALILNSYPSIKNSNNPITYYNDIIK